MISHRHKAVFIHIPKAGGQSIEDVFIRECGLSWRTRAPLLLRKNSLPVLGPPWLAHLTYLEYLECSYLSEDIMNDYEVFTITRNPYLRIESIYKYLGFGCAIPFSKFIKKILPKLLREDSRYYYFVKPQIEFLIDNERRIRVDRILKLEDIDSNFGGLREAVFLQAEKLPHVNKAKHRARWKTLAKRVQLCTQGVGTIYPVFDSGVGWNDELKSIVGGLYSEDFERLEYEK
jgi:hypothetical protein